MGINDTKEAIIAKRGYRASIEGDQYSLYLSNYPIAAEYLAGRLEGKGEKLLELCCGIGITLEAVAGKFKQLTGIEIDPEVLKSCRQNIETAGIADKVELILGNVEDEKLLKDIEADVVIYDIPYWVSKELPDGTNVLEKNPALDEMLEKIRKNVTRNIVVFAPPHFEYKNVRDKFGVCEFQKIFINGRYDRNYIFFGDLVENQGVTEKRLEYSILTSNLH